MSKKEINFCDEFRRIQQEELALFQDKNDDYGNSFLTIGIIGMLIRIQDKLNRCLILSEKEAKVKDESLEDSLMDISNYANMCLLVLRIKEVKGYRKKGEENVGM